MPKVITVLIADDEPVARAGIRSLLAHAEDIEIIGEAQDGLEAKDLIPKLRPQILLLDLKMPDTRPSEIEKWVRENYPEVVTLVLTSHDRDAYLAIMMDAGVAGYLNKEESEERLIGAIRRAAEGAVYFSDEQIAIVLISIVAMLISSAAISPSKMPINNGSPDQQSVIVHVEIVDSPSLEDQDWPIIKSETYKHTDSSTGEEIIDTLVIRRSPPGKCKGQANQATQIDTVTVTCTYRTSETRSSSVLAGGVTGYAKNYADNYCGGTDCTYYKLTKLEIWWTRTGTGWVVRSANTAWGCNGTCAVCPDNTSYSYLYQSGFFTPNFNGGLTSVTYQYTSTGWPIMKSTQFGIVWGGNNSTVESPTHTTQPLSVSANY